MSRKTVQRMIAIAITGLVAPVLWAQAEPEVSIPSANAPKCCNANAGGGAGQTAAPPTQSLTADEHAALVTAIQDEYRAQAIYAGVLNTFGEVLPFAHIIQAERRHAQALAALFERYGYPVPEPSLTEPTQPFRSVAEACTAAAQAERDNVAIYDDIMAKVDNPELLQVFAALRSASLDRHLPAFERCTNGGYGRNVQGQSGKQGGPRWGQGQGQQRGRGQGRGRGNSQGCRGRDCGRGMN